MASLDFFALPCSSVSLALATEKNSRGRVSGPGGEGPQHPALPKHNRSVM